MPGELTLARNFDASRSAQQPGDSPRGLGAQPVRRRFSLREMEEPEADSGISADPPTHSAVRAGRAHAARLGARCDDFVCLASPISPIMVIAPELKMRDGKPPS
jgi:hypothetical protein